jgi:hypothetical protein
MSRVTLCVFGLTMLLASSAIASSPQSPENPDVVKYLPYVSPGCEHAGQTLYASIMPSGNFCNDSPTFLETKHRPGLASYRPFYLDDQVALLILDLRTTLTGQRGDSSLMWSFAKPKKDRRSGKTYDRMTASVTVQCDTHDMTLSHISLLAVHDDREVLVASAPNVREESPLKSVEALIVAEVCKGPPIRPPVERPVKNRP